MPAVTAEEVRLLEGPNLYFPKPALKIRLDLTAYLQAPAGVVAPIASALGMRSRAGEPGSAQRQVFVQRLAVYAVRAVARAAGVSRVGVRVRPGHAPGHVTVAAVWRSRSRAEILGDGLAPLLQDLLDGAAVDPAVADLAARMVAAAPGSAATVRVPHVPVVSITGTNGKTTTTRIVAHLCMTAGKTTAWSSTDGIVVMGEVVEPGDYSGPAGARGVLDAPGLEIGVLETARGGLLLRGMGVTVNDVSVVTNVSADHLGLQGIDTLDQLAEVKAIITTVTKPGGWVVLNGEDPRVWAMRTRSRARPWAFALDPAAPALRQAVDAGGRGITVVDGDVTVTHPGGRTERIVALADVPATLSGLSVHNVANVLAAAAAGLALGLTPDVVAQGLRTFETDARLNPGRMNIYSIPATDGEATVIIDLAHNEAGLVALLDVARGLTAPGGRVLLALGTAGDRTDEILRALGEIAGQGADHVVIAHKEHYLRGRTTAEFEQQFGAGLARAGVAGVVAYRNEAAAALALAQSARDGDVVAVMTHEQRDALVEWIAQTGGHAEDAVGIRRKVVVAQGKHEREDDFAALWSRPDDDDRVDAAEALRTELPGDPRAVYEYASALDAAGREAEAVPAYQGALDGGLREPHRHRARVQLASSLRTLGRSDEAIAVLDQLAVERPESAAIVAFRALAQLDAGHAATAVADLVEALLARSADEDTTSYRAALMRYAAQVRPPRDHP